MVMAPKRKQMEYSGWSSEAEAASLDKWTKGMHLVDTIKKMMEKDLGYADKLIYYKQTLSKLRCFSFSKTKRIPNVWDAVNISKGEIKSNLDKVELLADEISAFKAANDAHLDKVEMLADEISAFKAANDAHQMAVIGNNVGNGNDRRDLDLDELCRQWQKDSYDVPRAFNAAFDALYAILNDLLDLRPLELQMSREKLEKKLGITWGQQGGPPKRKRKRSNVDEMV